MRQLNSALNYELRITINAQQALNTPIVLNYVNEESYWQADYEANYQQGQLSLALYANIYNRTAENWENAKIQLSTAKTQATLPATPIWQIGTQQGAIVAYAAPALYQNKASFSRANAQSNEQAFSK